MGECSKAFYGFLNVNFNIPQYLTRSKDIEMGLEDGVFFLYEKNMCRLQLDFQSQGHIKCMAQGSPKQRLLYVKKNKWKNNRKQEAHIQFK